MARPAAGTRTRRLRPLIMSLCLLATAGCVERQLVVNTEPTDALVSVDGREIGRSPAAMNFTFYGTRRITLQKDGYETSSELARVPAPWYQYFPIDFVSEVLWPGKVVDRHVVSCTLKKAGPTDPSALLERAQDLRAQVQQP